MRTAWLTEFLFLGLWVGLAGLVWLLFGGAFGWWLAVALAITGLRHIRQMQRLEGWLRSGRQSQPPQSWGVWGEVFEHYYRLQRRYAKRKKRLARVIREFRESTAAMPDGTLVLDADWRITWFNSASVRLLGLAGNRDLGQPVTSLLRAPAFDAYMRSGDFGRPVDVASPTQLGHTLSVRIVPYGRGQYLMLVRDITRIQRLQNMRRDFVANASHELRSPLTVLGGYLEHLAEDEAVPEIWDGPLQEMQVQCTRMATLVNDLLELSRLETDSPGEPDEQPVPVPDLVRRIVADAEAQAGGERTIEVDLDESLGLAGIENELYSAFSNLVFNAVRYTDRGGRIRVRWYRDRDGTARFCVVDDGIGIDARHLPFITQRFYRVDPSRSRSQGGTGLGLAIVKHVLQRHDSRLTVESEPGEGSEFCCVFPAHRTRGLIDAEGAA
ncbi:phosphate regulon sensor histidine kinase PhoR [Wenzhouxiangella sp. XN79A]|uniref:phosphate regulon sensor histidine kinase PhoR n=1 Tax=Wenzhouxiangella sp. XN79A TaxID=2724193 RepID=UPI00144A846C|nr:phosphate regulon sensor histidine kinase PhoR [Wenzhouxiangella sp. XN79A]NKI34602.1 phosphate regulon sensor histidine kinase PhoR [Wenzhouxiangella sp. XN79A]